MTGVQFFRNYCEKYTAFSDDDWQLLESHFEERQLLKGEMMIREGQRGKEVGFVLEGSLRQFYMYRGEERTSYFYFEHMLTGPYISCITGAPSQLSIEALTDSHLLVFPYQVLSQLYRQSHAWEQFGRKVAEYLAIGLEDRMSGLLMLSPEERYNALLQGNKHRILERIPQQYIANYLGITPVSLSRIRSRVHKR